MTTYVCLLRGVNVGGKNKLAMRALAELFESLGHQGVRTFIQSGNVVFSSKAKVTAEALESAIREEFSLELTAVLRTAGELQRVVVANPFEDRDKVHVAFLATKPGAAAVRALPADGFEPERFVVRGKEIYLYLPNGMARTRLPAHLDRRLGTRATIRNWKTTISLAELAAGS